MSKLGRRGKQTGATQTYNKRESDDEALSPWKIFRNFLKKMAILF